MSRRLLVTGGTGYLGSELLRQARGAGWETVGTWLSREPAGEADWLRLDVRDAPAVERALAELRPDAVVHTAYRQQGEGAYDVTVEGARAVAAAARAAGARLVHMSTDVLFDGRKGSPYVEEDEPTPIIEYGRAKADAERAVAGANPGALMVRTSLIYAGPPEPSRHERIALEAARGERDMAFFTDEIRCPVVVSDLAGALLELLEADVSGILHAAGADALSRYEFACLVARAHGLPDERIRAGSTTSTDAPRPTNCALDSSRAGSLLRTRLRGAREALADAQSRQ